VTPPRSPKSTAGFISFLKDRDNLVVNLLAAGAIIVPILARVAFPDSGPSRSLEDAANLFADICVGYFAAWIFYYLVSWRPRRADRDRALVRVGAAAIQASGQAKGLLDWLRQAAGDHGDGPITQKALAELAKPLTIMHPVPGMAGPQGAPATIQEMLWYQMDRCEERIKQCMRLAIFLDAELLSALLAIEDCNLFRMLRMLRQIPSTAELTLLVPEIYEYLLLSDALRELLYKGYRTVLDGVDGLSIEAVNDMRLTDGPLEWRPGSVSPWE
jgi:hypothetical protein